MERINRLKGALATPVFEDERKARLARLLNSLALYFIIPALIAGTVDVLVSNNPGTALLLWAGLWFYLAVGLVLIRWGYIQIAGWMCPVLCWTLVTLVVILSGGELSPIFGGYLLAILATALIFGARIGIVYALICLATVVALAVVDLSNIIPAPLITFTRIGTLAIYGLWIAGTAVLITGGTYLLRTALEKTERTAAFLRGSEAKFRKVVESSPGHVFFLDRQGQVQIVDPAGGHIIPNADRTVILYDGLYESDRSVFKDEIEACFSKGVVRQFEVRGVDLAFNYQVWLSPAKRSDNSVGHVMCNMYTYSSES